MAWLRQLAKRRFRLYDIEELQAGGNCGICGRWLPDVVVPKVWPWEMCEDCETGNPTRSLQKRKKRNKQWRKPTECIV